MHHGEREHFKGKWTPLCRGSTEKLIEGNFDGILSNRRRNGCSKGRKYVHFPIINRQAVVV